MKNLARALALVLALAAPALAQWQGGAWNGVSRISGPTTVTSSGSATAPSYGIEDTVAPMGWYRIGAGRLGAAVSGGNPLEIQYGSQGGALLIKNTGGLAPQLYSDGTGILQLGADSATPAIQTLTAADGTGTSRGSDLKIQAGTSSGVDQLGGITEIRGGVGTGNANGNSIYFYTPTAGASGAGLQSEALRWLVYSTGAFLPGADATYDIGTAGLRVRNVYVSGNIAGAKFSLLNSAYNGTHATDPRYWPVSGVFQAQISGIEPYLMQPMDFAGTITNLRCHWTLGTGGTGTQTVALRKNLADTTVTCAGTGAAATSCTDAAHTVTFVAGDLLTLGTTPTGTVGAGYPIACSVSGFRA